MTPSARIKAVIDVLEKIGKSKIPMDSTVGDYMRVRSYIGSKDRAFIAETVYAMARAHARLDWHLARAGGGQSVREWVIAWLSLFGAKGAGDIEVLFDGGKYSPQTLGPKEKDLLAKLLSTGSSSDPPPGLPPSQGGGESPDESSPLSRGEDKGGGSGAKTQRWDVPDMPESVRVECPPAYEATLRGVFGENFAAEMEAMMTPAPLDLRVNTLLADREKVKTYLAADRVETDETPYSPWGLRCRGKAFLSRTKAFVKGWIDIQDEGSQLIALVCGAQPGMQVLDYCAGAGGKTLALAGAMQKKGRIVAMDLEENRLEKGKIRFRRAGVSDIVETRPLSDDRHRKWLRRQKGTFDVVLCDAPCSGTGTWRRNPDMRWQVYGPQLPELLAVQRDILERVAHTVKPGGRLVYATCSLLPDENERQVEAFLKDHPEFEIMPLAEPWCEGPYMRLSPLRHNTDGFFAAVLRRIQGEGEGDRPA